MWLTFVLLTLCIILICQNENTVSELYKLQIELDLNDTSYNLVDMI